MTESLETAAEKIALACYGKASKISRLHSENNGVFLLVFEGNEKVLKIECEGSPQSKMKKEIAVISLIKQHGIPAPTIEHVGTDGAIIPNHWLIMTRAGNLNLHERYERSNDDCTKALYVDLGRILGRIHAIRFERQGHIEAERIDEKPFKLIVHERFEQTIKELAECLDDRELREATTLFNEFQDSEETRLCHADFGPWQAIIDDGRISAIIDWECAESSDPVYDFVKAELLISVFSGNLEEFRRGYLEVQTLPADFDRISIPYRVVEVLNLMMFFKKNEYVFGRAKHILDTIITTNSAP